ncbi:phage portal protein [Acetobacterium wieringae]|uniref:phage portal protein n=1 Tax=Acetobacterium wieringae TaxID=52694 RepID=UPI0020343ECA|nr:phage portal protein [Acetobacterium wieringae]URN83983.1 phage portal protein [Acetobacterium wieringae]
MLITETSRINAIVTEGAQNVISDLRFLELEISRWKTSPERNLQICGEEYYSNEHDILFRKRTMIGKNGELIELENLTNNKVIDNQYAKMVDQKKNYLVGKPFTVTSDDKGYADILKNVFDKSFMRMLKNVTEDAFNQGKGWVHPFYGVDGKLKFKRFEAYEILPFWNDKDHTDLEYAVRLYEVDAYTNKENREIVEKVEVYTKQGIDHYTLDDGRLMSDTENPHSDYIQIHANEVAENYNWEKIPLIAFKANNKEMPLIKRVKSLQDGINIMLSDFENRMQEDAWNTIIVLENYDGADLSDFRQNLAQFGAIKVRTDAASKGGVSTLNIAFTADNFKAILELFKKALIENARGYDAKDDRMSGNPNQMNIQSMYSDIDLDADDMETEYQASLEELAFFIDAHINNTQGKDYSVVDFDITFNRNVLINTGELIDNCQKSTGIVSNKTILTNHPFVDDVEKEQDELKQEKADAIDSYGAFPLEQQGDQVNTDETG